MFRRWGLFGMHHKWQSMYRTMQVVLLLGVIFTLIIIWQMNISLDIPYYITKNPAPAPVKANLTLSDYEIPSLNNDEFAYMDETCPVFKLKSHQNTFDMVTCKRSSFVPGSCHLMKTLFRSNPADCSHQTMNIICELKQVYNSHKPNVFCHPDTCRTDFPVYTALYNIEMGEYIRYKMNSVEETASFINTELLKDFSNHYHNNGYCLIQCFNKSRDFISQLLVLPPSLKSTNKKERKIQNKKQLLNVNILLLDSVSRHHFYRSLPKTIQKFDDLNENHFKSGQIFDFELVQAIKGRTFESLQALFGGDVKSTPIFDVWGMPPYSVNINETIGKFKASGYEILYVEDLCWKGEWGLVKEQRAMNLTATFRERVKLFNKAVLQAGIERLDISYSSCLILEENKVTNVFHGPKSICYNGIHQHSYLLQYIEYFLSHFSRLKKPTLTFLMLDTGHEDTGIRIKQLDESLANHVSFLAQQSNTISFIISDHGNNYGKFVSLSPESQVEIFQPFIFVILPDDASKILGLKGTKSLFINQKRLISLIDLHYTILALLPHVEPLNWKWANYNINRDGLLSPVSPYRTCKDIPRSHPNLCICQASYKPEENNSYYALFAEFALGYMNRQIIELQKNENQRKCFKLIGTRFDQVKSTQEDINKTIVLLDLYVKQPGIKGNSEERFTVSIFYSSTIMMEGMLFLGYNRLTPYNVYKNCASLAVDLRLCICETEPFVLNKTKRQEGDGNSVDTVLWAKTYKSLIDRPCLYLLTRNYTSGVVLSIKNVCSDIYYNIVFDFLTKNLYSSNQMPISETVDPVTEKILVVGIRKLENQPWSYKYILNCNPFMLTE